MNNLSVLEILEVMTMVRSPMCSLYFTKFIYFFIIIRIIIKVVINIRVIISVL
jgi:hypothetical protein